MIHLLPYPLWIMAVLSGHVSMVANAPPKSVTVRKKQEGYQKVLLQREQASRTDLLDAQYQRLEAEIWLNQEKAR
jgi:hypothetical protein